MLASIFAKSAFLKCCRPLPGGVQRVAAGVHGVGPRRLLKLSERAVEVLEHALKQRDNDVPYKLLKHPPPGAA
jgi:hypothetical protein